MKKLFWALWISAIPLVLEVRASNPTNGMAVEDTPDNRYFTTSSPRDGIINKFVYEMNRGGLPAYAGRFGPLSELGWMQSIGYTTFDRINKSGRDVFRNTLSDAARLTAMGYLPIEDWQDYGKGVGNDVWRFMVRFFIVGSIEDTSEANNGYVSTVPNWPFQSSDLKTAYGNGLVGYGPRISQTDPGVYWNIGVGHIAKQPVMFNTRCCAIVRTVDIRAFQIQEQVTIPISSYSRLVTGLALYPTEFDSSGERGPKVSVRLERVFKNVRLDQFPGIFFVGLEASHREVLLTCELSIPWG